MALGVETEPLRREPAWVWPAMRVVRWLLALTLTLTLALALFRVGIRRRRLGCR